MRTTSNNKKKRRREKKIITTTTTKKCLYVCVRILYTSTLLEMNIWGKKEQLDNIVTTKKKCRFFFLLRTTHTHTYILRIGEYRFLYIQKHIFVLSFFEYNRHVQ